MTIQKIEGENTDNQKEKNWHSEGKGRQSNGKNWQIRKYYTQKSRWLTLTAQKVKTENQ